jgi:hypothetical protein
MRLTKSLPISFLLVLTLFSASAAAPKRVEISCPSAIETSQKITSTHEGWSASPTGGRSTGLRHYGWISGFSDPIDGQTASLKPSTYVVSPSNRNVSTATWRFYRPSENFWAICTYSNTRIVLHKPLPAGIKQCSIELDENEGKARALCE